MKKIIYIDMDDVLCDFIGSYNSKIAKNPDIKYPQSQFNFWRDLKPLSGAIDSVKILNSSDQFSVYILTAPSIMNPLCYLEKRLWIEDYFGIEMVNQLIISPNKALNKGDYLIDDYDKGKGQDKFEGKLLHFGSKTYPNWDCIIDYFKEKYSI